MPPVILSEDDQKMIDEFFNDEMSLDDQPTKTQLDHLQTLLDGRWYEVAAK